MQWHAHYQECRSQISKTEYNIITNHAHNQSPNLKYFLIIFITSECSMIVFFVNVSSRIIIFQVHWWQLYFSLLFLAKNLGCCSHAISNFSHICYEWSSCVVGSTIENCSGTTCNNISFLCIILAFEYYFRQWDSNIMTALVGLCDIKFYFTFYCLIYFERWNVKALILKIWAPKMRRDFVVCVGHTFRFASEFWKCERYAAVTHTFKYYPTLHRLVYTIICLLRKLEDATNLNSIFSVSRQTTQLLRKYAHGINIAQISRHYRKNPTKLCPIPNQGPHLHILLRHQPLPN